MSTESVINEVVAERAGYQPKPGDPARCPRCDSPQPRLHPAMQFEGEVQPCPHAWHDFPERLDRAEDP